MLLLWYIMTVLVLQVLPVMLNIRHYSAQLEFFRSLAEGRQTQQVHSLLALTAKMHGIHGGLRHVGN